MEEAIIIGGGPAGLTAGLYLGRAGYNPLLLEGISAGGQLVITTTVENFPGFPNGIEGPKLMENMRKQAQKFAVKIISSDAQAVNLLAYPFTVMVDNEIIETRSVVIAAGSSSRWLGLESEQRLIGRGVTSCATCDAPFYRDKLVGVVGGGDTACEEALYLTRFARKVYLIHRRDELRASKIMAERVFAEEKIELLWNSVVTEVIGEKSVLGVLLKDTKNNNQRELKIDGLFIAIGHNPNTEIFRGQMELDDNGYIRVKDYTRTSIEGVFACGDVADPIYKQAVTASGTGCMAALDVIRYLEKTRR